MRLNFQSFLPHIAAIGIFIIAASFYFSPQFSGKVITQGDIIGYRGMSQELREYKAETGEDALWTNSMFGGMPSYQINTVSSGNMIKKLERVVRMFIKPPAGQFIAARRGRGTVHPLLSRAPYPPEDRRDRPGRDG